jgi:hypothetical protein
MRKFFTLVLLAMAVSAAYSQTNVPNGDFENWYNIVVSPQINYDELGIDSTDNWMGTLNSLAKIPPIANGPGPVTVFKSTDKYSGLYAAKAVSANFPLGPVTVFIPGMLGTAVMDVPGVRAILGKPCPDCKPLRFKGYYKYEPINNDSCAAVLLLSKWNDTEKKRDTIGYGQMVQRNAVSTYTPFDIPITYTGTATVDTMTLLLVSSAGFNIISFMQSHGQPGSTMYVDDLMLEYGEGIDQVLMPEVSVKTFPNPASDLLNVEISKEVKNGKLEVCTSAGKMVGSFGANMLRNSIPLYNMVNGIYYYRLMDGKHLLNTGSFVVKK